MTAGEPPRGLTGSGSVQPRVQSGRAIPGLPAILCLVAVAVAVVVVGWLVGWHPLALLLGAFVLTAGGAMLLYRQARGRESAQRSLLSAEARMRGIVECAMDPVIGIDASQRVVVFNAAAERVFRWPRAAVLGQPLDLLLPERFRGGHRHLIEHFGRTGVTSRRMGSQTVLTALRADGAEFPIEASISQFGEGEGKVFTVILRNIAERVSAETQIARSEARLRGILDSAMDAVITIDETQHIVLFNLAAEHMFGCPRDQAIGAPLAWFLPERFRDAHGSHVRLFGATDTTSRRMGAQRIVTGLRRNGEEFPIDAAISQLTEGGKKYYTVILRDVTARVQAEEALTRSQQELQELGKAAHLAGEREKNRIARELHDELAQTLTELRMDVAWLRQRIPPEQDLAHKRLDKMESLLGVTVAATRRIAADLRPLILDDLGLIPAVEWLAENFTERTGIHCELAVSDADLKLSETYATAVFRIVQESLTNIAKHAKASHVEVVLERDTSQVSISVSDNGVGFSPQTPRNPHSYGLLGLRERANLLGGEARIHSVPGRGTEIEVVLPVAPGPGPA